MEAKDHVKQLGESMSEMLEGHLKLFKMELKDDAAVLAENIVAVAALLPLILVGWGFLCVALGLYLGKFMPLELAYLLMAGLNLVVAGTGIGLALARLSKRNWLSRTKREAQKSVAIVTTTVASTTPERTHA